MSTVKRVSGDYVVESTDPQGKISLESSEAVITGSLAIQGNISTIDPNAAINFTASDIAMSGNLSIGGNVVVTGNVASNQIFNGTSSVVIADLDTPIIATVAGSTVANISTAGLAVTGVVSSTGNLFVNTNKFTVTAASGNVAVAGTLGVTGATTVSNTLGVTGTATVGNGSTNYLTLNGNSTGQPAYVTAAGADTNVGIDLNSKGTGAIRLNINSATVMSAATTGISVTGTMTTTKSGADNLITVYGGVGNAKGVSFYDTAGSPTGAQIYSVSDDLRFFTNTAGSITERMRLTTTGISVTGKTTSTGSTAFSATGQTTNPALMEFVNTGGTSYVGATSSGGGGVVTGGHAYALTVAAASGRGIDFGDGSTLLGSWTTTGLSVTGTGTFTAANALRLTYASSDYAAIQMGTAGTVYGQIGWGTSGEVVYNSAAGASKQHAFQIGGSNVGVFSVDGLSVTATVAATQGVTVTNTSSATAAAAAFTASNGINTTGYFGTQGTGYSTYGVLQANRTGIYSSHAAGVFIASDNAAGSVNIGVGAAAPAVGVFSTTGLAVTGGITSDQGASAYGGVRFSSGRSDSGSRDWGAGTNYQVYGDWVLRVSNAKDGNPFSAGTTILSATSSGLAVTGNITTTTTGDTALEVVSTGAANGVQVLFKQNGATVGTIGNGTSISGGAATDVAIYSAANIDFAAGGITRKMRIDSSGNLGLGVTPSVWGGAGYSGKAIEFGALGNSLWGVNATNVYLMNNVYYNGEFKYASNNPGSYYLQQSGSHIWGKATGTPGAGNAASLAAEMTLDASGYLGVGTTTLYPGLTVADATNLNNTARLNLRNNNSDGANRIGIIGYGSNAIAISTGDESTGNANNTLAYFAPTASVFYTGTTNTNPTERMRIDSGGNLLLGTTTASNITSFSASATGMAIQGAIPVIALVDSDDTTNYTTWFSNSGGTTYLYNRYASGYLVFGNANAEAARFNTTNYFKASNLGSYYGLGDLRHEFSQSAANDTVLLVNTHASTPYGCFVYFSAAAPNNATQYFYSAQDNAATRFRVYANGGIANYQTNDVNLCDRREKTNFAPARSYLGVVCSIPVQTFNYVDQNLEDDPGLTLGVVAQDVREVAPELVHESDWGTKDEPKMRLSIYQTDLQYALMKCIQELSAKNDALEARLAALEAA